jgi:hypothetical protein
VMFEGQPRMRNGWLEVPCDAPDAAKVYMAVGEGQPRDDQWLDAYRDWDDNGVRVAKIRPPTLNPDLVWIKVNDQAVRLNRRVVL